jgi:hypothetical protein
VVVQLDFQDFSSLLFGGRLSGGVLYSLYFKTQGVSIRFYEINFVEIFIYLTKSWGILWSSGTEPLVLSSRLYGIFSGTLVNWEILGSRLGTTQCNYFREGQFAKLFEFVSRI